MPSSVKRADDSGALNYGQLMTAVQQLHGSLSMGNMLYTAHRLEAIATALQTTV